MMNRKQRRSQPKVAMVKLSEITLPWDMPDDAIVEVFRLRLQNNLRETLHPFHHKTANGVIVAPDPTLEYYMRRLRANPQYKKLVEEVGRDLAQYEEDMEEKIPPAQPVNRKFYGFDMYERH